jgi:polar amino acid transport system substrate-binding protein
MPLSSKQDGKQDAQARQGGVRRREVFGLSAAGATGAVVAASALAAPLIREARAQSTSSSRLQSVLDRGHVIVGTGSTNPPWHFEDETGKLVGMDIDLAKLLAKGLFEDPEKVEFVLGAADARIPNLVTDKVDVIFQFMTITPGRAQQAEFTIPYYREGVGFMMMKGADHQTYDDLKAGGGDVTISALQNVFIEDWIHLALPEAKVDQYDSVDTEIQAINSRRAHAAALDQSTIGWLISQFPDRYVDSGYGWMPNSYAAAVKPGDQVWLNFVNSVLHEAMTGVDFLSYQASFEKWFGQKIEPPRVGFPVEYS